MEFDQNINLQPDANSENNDLDIRALIEKYLSYWKWFVLSFLLSIAFAFYNLNFKRPQYQAVTTIKINDDKGGDESTLAVFQDLGMMSGSKDKIEDEIEILKSKSLVAEVVKSLNLNVSFFTSKNKLSSFLDDNLGFSTEFYDNEEYSNPPLKINFLISDSTLYKTQSQFIITVNSINSYSMLDLTNEDATYKKHDFGSKVSTIFGDVIILPNIDLKKNNLIGKNILVNIVSLDNLVDGIVKGISIQPKSEFSSILSLSITDGVPLRAENLLDELVTKYNNRAITLKNELTKSTSDFVTERLEIISEELSNVDLTAESLKTRYKLSDAASDAGLNMQSGQAIESQIVQANMQLEQISAVKEYVSLKDANELIPVDVGVKDKSVSGTMQQYNELMMQKKKFLKNSTEKNPILVNINEQLATLKKNIDIGLESIESSQKNSIDALTAQNVRINSRLYAAPKQERQYRDIQRQQQIKEQLYLYLLQKREETAITLGIRDTNAKIIDYAQSDKDPVAPKKKIALLIAGFIGLLIPLGIVYTIDMLDSKIHTREEVEKVLNIPIIGDIPKIDSKDKYLIKTDDYSSTAEAFRILRTNLNFILPKDNTKRGKTIFVTSTIAHEGKSLVSTNLATVFAHAGKRTLILGMDIRAPRIKSYLKVRGKSGVTNFIVNPELDPKDLIVKVPIIENLDIISSGDIAPNPAELLMNPRVNELFEFAKTNYDYIIVDTAAYSMVTDTLLLSNFADAFIYVIRANFLDKRALKYIKSLYREKRLPNMVLLINEINYKKSHGYGYGYGYGYGSKFEESKKRWWKFTS